MAGYSTLCDIHHTNFQVHVILFNPWKLSICFHKIFRQNTRFLYVKKCFICMLPFRDITKYYTVQVSLSLSQSKRDWYIVTYCLWSCIRYISMHVKPLLHTISWNIISYLDICVNHVCNTSRMSKEDTEEQTYEMESTT